MYELATLQNEQRDLLTTLYPRVVIEDESALALAGEALTLIRGYVKRVEDARTALVKPLNDHVGWINTQFKALLEPVRADEARVKALMTGYRTALMERLRAEDIKRTEEVARAAAKPQGATQP